MHFIGRPDPILYYFIKLETMECDKNEKIRKSDENDNSCNKESNDNKNEYNKSLDLSKIGCDEKELKSIFDEIGSEASSNENDLENNKESNTNNRNNSERTGSKRRSLIAAFGSNITNDELGRSSAEVRGVNQHNWNMNGMQQQQQQQQQQQYGQMPHQQQQNWMNMYHNGPFMPPMYPMHPMPMNNMSMYPNMNSYAMNPMYGNYNGTFNKYNPNNDNTNRSHSFNSNFSANCNENNNYNNYLRKENKMRRGKSKDKNKNKENSRKRKHKNNKTKTKSKSISFSDIDSSNNNDCSNASDSNENSNESSKKSKNDAKKKSKHATMTQAERREMRKDKNLGNVKLSKLDVKEVAKRMQKKKNTRASDLVNKGMINSSTELSYLRTVANFCNDNNEILSSEDSSDDGLDFARYISNKFDDPKITYTKIIGMKKYKKDTCDWVAFYPTCGQ